jgi:hypothetical protein
MMMLMKMMMMMILMIDDYDGPPQPHMPRQGFIDIASCPNIRQGMLTSAGIFRDEIERDQAC